MSGEFAEEYVKELETKIQKAKKVIDLMVKELPKTMGEPNIQLIYDDIKEVADILSD